MWVQFPKEVVISIFIHISLPHTPNLRMKLIGLCPHLIISLPPYTFSSFFSMRQLWLLAGAHGGILELEAEWSGWKHQNLSFMCFPFNRYIFPHQGKTFEQNRVGLSSLWVTTTIKFQVSSYCFFIACFLPGSAPVFPEVLEVELEPLLTGTKQG